ncbi:MAG: MMPL family transporter [Lachnospiraceae bacterium]|nr:MMPL family transporter [Lachnospiraceae bacterium]
MIKFGKGVVKLRVPIFILSLLLLIPSAIGYLNTGINYDLLSYLPGELETMKGQDILVDEFGTGAFSFYIVENKSNKEISEIKEKILAVPHVEKVIWYDSLADLSVPMSAIPDDIYQVFNSETCTMMAIIFDDTTSSEGTMKAITTIRELSDEDCYLSGMSPVVADTKIISETETPIYVAIAAVLSAIVLSLTMDSFLVPLLFLMTIGMSIIYNLGTNIFMREISYITQALAAVLQLGVTMDYAIFLWHSYEEQKERFQGDKERAMSHAIKATISSVVGSSITTVAGFIALCFMSFTLGLDLGIVMSKGVILGVVACITILPSMILIFDKAITKTHHKPVIQKPERLPSFISKHYLVFGLIFIIVLSPAYYGNSHAPVYYNIADTLPETLDSVKANNKLSENFSMNSTHMILFNSQLSGKEKRSMIKEMEDVDGVEWVLGYETILGPTIPESWIPEEVTEALENDTYEIYLISSQYKVASDEVNNQCTQLNDIIKSHDSNALLVGEAPCTKDLITTTDKDFQVVSIISIGAIVVIIALVFRSISLPVILVAVIEFAIFINMAVPYYTNTSIPFIASVVIGTIQLGATVDYAILMTTRYKKERRNGATKKDATYIALDTSMMSVVGSALSFFSATIGVALYSDIDMISAICMMLSRGAIISMFVVLCILPSMYMIFDKVICYTSIGFLPKKTKNNNNTAINI